MSDVPVTESEPIEMTVHSIANGSSKYGKYLVYVNHGFRFGNKKLINNYGLGMDKFGFVLLGVINNNQTSM